MLTRETQFRRSYLRRSARPLGYAACGAAATAVLLTPLLMASTRATSLTARVVVEPEQELRVVQVPLPVPTVELPALGPGAAHDYGPGTCPEPGPRGVDPKIPYPEDGYWGFLEDQPILGAAVSPTTHGVLAAWSRSEIFLSTDDGRRFTRVLDGPGKVRALAIDCHDRVIAIRDEHIGVRQGTRETWTAFPVFDPNDGGEPDEHPWKPVELVAKDGYLAAFGPANLDTNRGVLVSSADGGATWRFDTVGYYDEHSGPFIDRDGIVRLVTTWYDCMDEGRDALTVNLATGKRTSKPIQWDSPVPARPGWTQWRDKELPENGFCAKDPSGRLLGIDDNGKLVRWSRKHGLRILHGQTVHDADE